MSGALGGEGGSGGIESGQARFHYRLCLLGGLEPCPHVEQLGAQVEEVDGFDAELLAPLRCGRANGGGLAIEAVSGARERGQVGGEVVVDCVPGLLAEQSH